MSARLRKTELANQGWPRWGSGLDRSCLRDQQIEGPTDLYKMRQLIADGAREHFRGGCPREDGSSFAPVDRQSTISELHTGCMSGLRSDTGLRSDPEMLYSAGLRFGRTIVSGVRRGAARNQRYSTPAQAAPTKRGFFHPTGSGSSAKFCRWFPAPPRWRHSTEVKASAASLRCRSASSVSSATTA
jgi:hypothetical protein